MASSHAILDISVKAFFLVVMSDGVEFSSSSTIELFMGSLHKLCHKMTLVKKIFVLFCKTQHIQQVDNSLFNNDFFVENVEIVPLILLFSRQMLQLIEKILHALL